MSGPEINALRFELIQKVINLPEDQLEALDLYMNATETLLESDQKALKASIEAGKADVEAGRIHSYEEVRRAHYRV